MVILMAFFSYFADSLYYDQYYLISYRFVTIRDNSFLKDLISCAYESRSVSTYVSQSHRLEVRMLTGVSNGKEGLIPKITAAEGGNQISVGEVNFVQFVIKYEGEFMSHNKIRTTKLRGLLS